jgi:hypothetical protein
MCRPWLSWGVVSLRDPPPQPPDDAAGPSRRRTLVSEAKSMGNVPQQLGGFPAFAGNAHGDAVGVCVETHEAKLDRL